MGAKEVEAFLSHLAVDRKVSASTQNQAKRKLRVKNFGVRSKKLRGQV